MTESPMNASRNPCILPAAALSFALSSLSTHGLSCRLVFSSIDSGGGILRIVVFLVALLFSVVALSAESARDVERSLAFALS